MRAALVVRIRVATAKILALATTICTDGDGELIEQVGLALYGEHWLTPLAAAMGINSRTVRRWAAGQQEVRSDSGEASGARARADKGT